MNKTLIKQILIAAAAVISFLSIKLLIWKDAFICPFNSLAGLYCPGCGGMRCIMHLLHGNIRAAFDSNFLLGISFTSIPLIIAVLLKNRKGMNLTKYLNLKYLILVLVAISVFTVLRNIPHYPFTILKP